MSEKEKSQSVPKGPQNEPKVIKMSPKLSKRKLPKISNSQSKWNNEQIRKKKKEERRNKKGTQIIITKTEEIRNHEQYRRKTYRYIINIFVAVIS